MRWVRATAYAGKFETGAISPAVQHLEFLDGLRGVAALYILLHHSCRLAFLTIATPKAFFFFGWGHAVVTIFIAISGYCLSLPVVRSGLTLKGGALHFYRKRARRILTPYYASLAMGIMMFAFLTAPGHRLSIFTDSLNRKAIIAHLFMVHNWLPDVMFTINGPLWSVAMEMQIYMLFPLIVLGWKRFGTIWMLASTFLLSHLVFFLSGHRGPANYLFIFVLGAWAANLSPGKRNMVYLKSMFYICMIAFLALPDIKDVYSDLLVGVGVSCMMAVCAQTTLFWPRSVLSLRFFTWLGGFSYSIYLIHSVLQSIYLRMPWIPAGFPLLFFLLGIIPIILGVSYLFHMTIERPFMTVHTPRT
jgi:peptidoglycan/LPS O-acetylase OafA/YrhL